MPAFDDTLSNSDPQTQLRLTFLVWSRALIYAIGVFLLTGSTWVVFGQIEILVNVPGTIVPVGKIQILQSSVAGTVKQLKIRDGEAVKQGSVIAILDDTELRMKLASLQNERLLVEEQLRQDRVSGGKESLILNNLQRITSIQAQVLEIERNIELCTLRAPVTGFISEQFIKAFDQIQSGQKVCSILPEQAVFLVEAQLPANEIRRVKSGQMAKLQLQAYPVYDFGLVTGVVDSIALEALPTESKEPNATPGFKLQIRISDDAAMLSRRSITLKPGLQCQAGILVETKSPLQILCDKVIKQ